MKVNLGNSQPTFNGRLRNLILGNDVLEHNIEISKSILSKKVSQKSYDIVYTNMSKWDTLEIRAMKNEKFTFFDKKDTPIVAIFENASRKSPERLKALSMNVMKRYEVANSYNTFKSRFIRFLNAI